MDHIIKQKQFIQSIRNKNDLFGFNNQLLIMVTLNILGVFD